VLCLHRQDGALGFDDGEVGLLRRLAPHLGRGLRQAVALMAVSGTAGGIGGEAAPVDGPGIVVLDADLAIAAINPQAERWLHDIAGVDWPAHLALPVPIHAAAMAARLAAGAPGPPGPPPTATLRRASGGWITVHASPLAGPGGPQVAVVLDAADPTDVSSMVLAAHGLTPAQTRVVALVLQGRSTRHIVGELHISAHTVQEHLHAVFDKFGIGSRRELVAALSGRRH
jgi:DNA-binding CsgD family transcriptional regulator